MNKTNLVGGRRTKVIRKAWETDLGIPKNGKVGERVGGHVWLNATVKNVDEDNKYGTYKNKKFDEKLKDSNVYVTQF